MIRLLSALLVLLVFPVAPVQGQGSIDRETLQVGVRVAPPFVIPDGAGGYDGLAVRLWEAVATEMGVDYVYHVDRCAERSRAWRGRGGGLR